MANYQIGDVVTAINTAFAWHGGGGSPFYRFASTRMVQSEEHRRLILEDELADCLLTTRHEGDRDETRRLQHLGDVVRSARVGRELVSYQGWKALSG